MIRCLHLAAAAAAYDDEEDEPVMSNNSIFVFPVVIINTQSIGQNNE